MKSPRVSMVVAIDDKRGLGKDDKLVWDVPEDRKHFRDLTLGHPVILGRKTFESIVGYIKKPLPNRINIIVTRDPDYSYEGCIVVHSIEEAIEEAKKVETDEIFIGGGGSIYLQALPYTDRIYLTKIEGEYETDTYFPEYSKFKAIEESPQQTSQTGTHYTFQTLEK